jgi:hypothetical protein
MEKDLDHDKSGSLELNSGGQRTARKIHGATHSNSSGLCDKANRVETKFSLRGESDARRNHDDDDGEFLVGIFKAECPLN